MYKVADMEKEENQIDGSSKDVIIPSENIYRYQYRDDEDEETWAELPDLLLEEIYVLLANKWRNYCSQVMNCPWIWRQVLQWK